ncbi:hypothetical protein [Halanaerobaculum tunisiense]
MDQLGDEPETVADDEYDILSQVKNSGAGYVLFREDGEYRIANLDQDEVDRPVIKRESAADLVNYLDHSAQKLAEQGREKFWTGRTSHYFIEEARRELQGDIRD